MVRKGVVLSILALVLATPGLAQGIFDQEELEGGLWEPVGGQLEYNQGLVIAYGFAGGGFVAVLVVIVFGGFVFYRYKYKKKEEATGELTLFGKYNY